MRDWKKEFLDCVERLSDDNGMSLAQWSRDILAQLEKAEAVVAKAKSEMEAINPEGHKHMVLWQMARDYFAEKGGG